MTATDAIERYLKAEFPSADISLLDPVDEKNVAFLVDAEGNRYCLRVERSFLDKRTPDQISQTLTQFTVAEVMRGLRDFPVTLTEYGCIF